ncbi:hypothetical protein PIROE2DRAFT_3389 [Piromyces sp. E2]|nr:hypothetical protein PIROE2DRAFT_3389 [Piromyces sp. E2]|eukprot:OUM68858.1 hypothetical protein PIROE2DRAFT_3389 [Piromyces sp. E2]
MDILQFFKPIHKLPIYLVKTFVLISLLSYNSLDNNNILNNSIIKYNSNKFGIKLAGAYYANTYFDYNPNDRILNVAEFGFEKSGTVYIKLDDVVLQYQRLRFRMKENDKDNNNPYYKNITDNDNSNYNNNKKNEKRTIEEIIYENIIETKSINYNDLISIKSFSNYTKSFNSLNDTGSVIKTKIEEYFIPVFPNESHNDFKSLNFGKDDNLIEDIPRSLARTENESTDGSSSENNNKNYTIEDRFLDLLQESKIHVNLTDFYSLAVDLESYVFRMEIPKEDNYIIKKSI